MTTQSLEELIARARHRKMTPAERREQRVSFALGNGSIEDELHRGTVTIAAPPEQSSPDLFGTLPASRSPGHNVDTTPNGATVIAAGGLRQYDLIEAIIADSLERSRPPITMNLVQTLHARLFEPDDPQAGHYRSGRVWVSGSPHEPPSPNEIRRELAAMCEEINTHWDDRDSLELAAHALWRLNWIHPFPDGNGRTARALCYLILNLKARLLLPGTPTVLEQFRAWRVEYFDALAEADAEYKASGRPSLTSLITLLRIMLERQLTSGPALGTDDAEFLEEIFVRRVQRATPAARRALYGEEHVASRSWAFTDHFILHVANRNALNKVDASVVDFGAPFPGLLALPQQAAQTKLTAEMRGAILPPHHYLVEAGAALWFEPNAAAIVERSTFTLRRPSGPDRTWSFEGALYVVRAGDKIGGEWTLDTLDFLLSRHMQAAV